MEKKSNEPLTLNVDTTDALANMEKLRISIEATSAALERLNALLPVPGSATTTVNNVAASPYDTIRAVLADARTGLVSREQAIRTLRIVAGLSFEDATGLLEQAPPKYTPPPEMKSGARAALDAAAVQEYQGATTLWNAHRAALGGVSSVPGAPLPDWSDCNVLAQHAHLMMFRAARDFLMAHGYVQPDQTTPHTPRPGPDFDWDDFAKQWVQRGEKTGPAITTNTAGA